MFRADFGADIFFAGTRGAGDFAFKLGRRTSRFLFCVDRVWRQEGSEHPDSDFVVITQQRNAATRRKKIGWCGFHDNKRYTRRRPARTI